MSQQDAIITGLQDVLGKEEGLAELLEQSLVNARKSAEAELNADLFEALDWPEDIAQYEEYLKGFLRWLPRQSDATAWRGMDPGQRHAKEVSDRISHFFFLVDQDGERGAPQDSGAFRDWMTEFARQWGSFLDTPESFSPEILQSFIENAPEYRVYESLVEGKPNEASGWLTFNQFFGRRLNGGLRPIAEPGSNTIVTSPADCVFQHAYDIDGDSNIPAITIKNTHKYGNITQLIEGSRYAESFARGTFVHYMLKPSSYHRFHLPVSGRIAESFRNAGTVCMHVGLKNQEFVASDSATTGFEFAQNRGVVTVDTADSDGGDIGIVAVIPVGMAHVSSVVITAAEDTRMAKGEEFGYFQFGGSDIIVLFQEGAAPEIDTGEHYRLYGTPIARCRPRGS